MSEIRLPGESARPAPSVLIVGAGPAGMVLAYQLASHGVPVRVLERHADFRREFRGELIHEDIVAVQAGQLRAHSMAGKRRLGLHMMFSILPVFLPLINKKIAAVARRQTPVEIRYAARAPGEPGLSEHAS